MLNKKLGVIGGSGLYQIDGSSESKWETITTPWGDPSDQILTLKFDDQEVYFIPRHHFEVDWPMDHIKYFSNY